MGNSFGKFFVITSFGESHGEGVGIVIDGCPAGLALTEADIQLEVDKRSPVTAGATARAEADEVEILSGVFNGFTTGAPICLVVRNSDTDPVNMRRCAFCLVLDTSGLMVPYIKIPRV